MSNKRDYYEVLGVSKNADEAEIKRLIANLRSNITPIKTPMTPVLRKNSKKLLRLMKS